jgi:hypothetical protein
MELSPERGGRGFFEVTNGYTFSNEKDLESLDMLLSSLSQAERDDIVARVRIGVHEDVGVTFNSRFVATDNASPPLVTQCYCSALSWYTNIIKHTPEAFSFSLSLSFSLSHSLSLSHTHTSHQITHTQRLQWSSN